MALVEPADPPQRVSASRCGAARSPSVRSADANFSSQVHWLSFQGERMVGAHRTGTGAEAPSSGRLTRRRPGRRRGLPGIAWLGTAGWAPGRIAVVQSKRAGPALTLEVFKSAGSRMANERLAPAAGADPGRNAPPSDRRRCQAPSPGRRRCLAMCRRRLQCGAPAGKVVAAS